MDLGNKYITEGAHRPSEAMKLGMSTFNRNVPALKAWVLTISATDSTVSRRE